MKKISTSNKKLLSLSMFIVCLLVSANIAGLHIILGTPIENSIDHSINTLEGKSISNLVVEETSEHEIRLMEFSHYNKPIYANYSIPNLTVRFESAEVDIADLELFYTNNFVNWTSVSLVETIVLSSNSSLFEGSMGPFSTSGNYFVEVNATRGSVLLASLNFIINVEAITGLVFVDFDHQIIQYENGSQSINIQINVLGNELNISTVQVIANQPEESFTKIQMYKVNGTNNLYNASYGSIDEWIQIVKLTFTANTTAGINYTNTNFQFVKSLPIYPENFWRNKFPGIIAGFVAVGAMAGIFILSRVKPPRKFDIEKADDELDKQKKKAKRKEIKDEKKEEGN
ncbi:MAG: hypothetical protein ACFFDW_00860 [Candidatus Thorarchaeota archaeon]